MFLNQMVSVKKTREQSKDSMLRRFTRLVIDEGIVDEVRDRMFYKSPSLIKKEKSKGGVRRHRFHR